jgi:osmotically-inducible protein OsmY
MLVQTRQFRRAKAADSQDRTIQAHAERSLRRFRPISLRNVTCEVRHGNVTLAGTTKSFYMKQLAHVAVANIEGVKRVANLIEVTDGVSSAAS